MLSQVTVLCFAASYGVALLLELTRLLFRSRVRGAVMLGFTAAGLVAHTAFLFYQGVRFNDQIHGIGSPLSSTQHWYLTAAWVLAVVYLLLTFSYPKVQFGLFFLPLVLALIGVGHHFADPEPAVRVPDARIWGLIHGGSLLVATVAVLVGFAAGVMYLGQARRLKHKRPAHRGLRLPSLEWLQKTNSRSIVAAMATLAVGIVSGMILNVIHHDREKGFVPWTDPVIVITVGMFAWLLLSSLIGLIYKPAREGHKVAYLTVVSFVFLVVALAVGLFVDTRHGGQRQSRPGRAAPRSAAGIAPHSDRTATPTPGGAS